MDVCWGVFDQGFEAFLRIFFGGVEEEAGGDGTADAVEVATGRGHL